MCVYVKQIQIPINFDLSLIYVFFLFYFFYLCCFCFSCKRDSNMYICLDKHVQRKEFQIEMEQQNKKGAKICIWSIILNVCLVFYAFFWGNFDHSPTDGAFWKSFQHI